MNDPRPAPAILALTPSAVPPDPPVTASPTPNPTTDAGTTRRGKSARPVGSQAEESEVGRLALRLEEIATALGVSRRAIERERSAGRLPKPDRVIGRMPLWRVETIRAWMGGAGRRSNPSKPGPSDDYSTASPSTASLTPRPSRSDASQIT